MMEAIRYHIDKLELVVDDQIWTLPKYRELLCPKGMYFVWDKKEGEVYFAASSPY